MFENPEKPRENVQHRLMYMNNVHCNERTILKSTISFSDIERTCASRCAEIQKYQTHVPGEAADLQQVIDNRDTGVRRGIAEKLQQRNSFTFFRAG